MNRSRSKDPISLDTLVKALGWFSIALGAAELLAPREVSGGAGLRKQDTLLQGYGLREIATGVGLLLSNNPAPWLWGRVAGDALDAATVVATADPRKKGRLGASAIVLLAVGALDFYAALRATRGTNHPLGPSHEKRDYRRRSGFPRPSNEMRGAALDRSRKSKGSLKVAGPDTVGTDAFD